MCFSVGWASPDRAEPFLMEYNSTSETEYFKAVDAEWTYNTNINDETQAASVSGGLETKLKTANYII